ncbi:FG-GAP-like repeat-containing protein [Polaromonas sp. YR568]|uniref:FG-GAP-like repeat-containing protein n=1 Tax=Polaromonas sp. YR568 TaxID=1855301 RepID=UPI000B887C0B|nr:FG-GAP-like repeat-containing protein [Polaromonas sp. YR568]
MNDRYCLDGQRLILVSGTYGATGSEYKTELDSFSRIIATGTAGNGVAYFTVQTKAGLTMEYGNTADSRIEAQGKTSVRVWAVNKISDVKTNFMTFSYTEDDVNGEYYLARVDYAGNVTAGASPASQIRFNYEARPDILVRYRNGAKSRTPLRMTSVQAYAGLSLVKSYALSYDNLAAGGSTRLTGIQECENTNACVQPTNFGWLTGTNGMDAAVVATDINGSGWTSSAYPRRFADVNGDGMPDIVLIDKDEAVAHVFLAKGDGSFLAQPVSTDVNGSGWTESAYPRYLIDVNGDGRADLVMAANSEAEVYVFLGQANGSFSQQAVVTDVNGSGWISSAYPRRFADVNGDGLLDFVLIDKDEAVPYVFLGKEDGSFMAQPVSTDVNGSGWTESAYPRYLMDVNGDGRADLVMVANSEAQVHVFLGQENGSFSQQALSTDVDGSGWTSSAFSRQFADVNGDGLPDFILISKDEAVPHVFLGKGDGTFLGQPVSTDIDGNGWAESTYLRNFADINGDGRADLVMTLISEAKTYVWLGQADGSFVQQPVSTDINGDGWTSSAYVREFADINGDGKSDLILVTESEAIMHVSLSRFPASLLQSVSRGSDITATIAYKPLTDSVFYAKDTEPNASAYPKLDLQYAQYVVSSVASSNGVGGTVTTQYNYGGLKAEQGTGRGMLGFRWMRSKNLANNIESYTEFNQSWPLTGSVAKSETRLAGSGNAGVLKRATNSYAQGTGSATGTTFVYPSQSVEESWDLGGAAYPTVTNTYQYGQSPQYGDPTQISVTNSAGAGKTTVNEYWPANTGSGSWVLGRLKKATVTSVAP